MDQLLGAARARPSVRAKVLRADADRAVTAKIIVDATRSRMRLMTGLLLGPFPMEPMALQWARQYQPMREEPRTFRIASPTYQANGAPRHEAYSRKCHTTHHEIVTS